MRLLPILAALWLLSSCGTHHKTQAGAHPIGTPIAIPAPLGLPPVPIPADNPPTAETIALGRRLFYDMRLSGDETLSCAGCHNPQLDFTDGRRVAQGVHKQQGSRNTPTILDAAYNLTQFWDGRAPSLEDQSGGRSRIR